MENDRRWVHRHESRVDTCPDCIQQLTAERYPFARPAGGVRGRKGPQVVAVHPNPIYMQVFNHDNGKLTWFEVDQASLIDLLDTDLARTVG
jgi:hypothetical protein